MTALCGLPLASCIGGSHSDKDKDNHNEPRTATASAASNETNNGDGEGEKMEKPRNPIVVLETSLGKIELEIYADQAPISAKNFLSYVDQGFYDGTIFHRVINGFMIQGGGFTAEMSQKPTGSPIKNEAANGLKNETGTIAMARTMSPDSATAQFFINVADNTFLNHRSSNPQEYGYAVFGKVKSGMEIVNQIKAVPTTTRNGHENVPSTPVVIQSAKRSL